MACIEPRLCKSKEFSCVWQFQLVRFTWVAQSLGGPSVCLLVPTTVSNWALLKVKTDLIMALENQEVDASLLWLSAAFDTIDHNILLRRLEMRLPSPILHSIGLRSYLTTEPRLPLLVTPSLRAARRFLSYSSQEFHRALFLVQYCSPSTQHL